MEITCKLTGINPGSSAVALWTKKKIRHRGSFAPLLSLLVEVLQQGGLRAVHFLDQLGGEVLADPEVIKVDRSKQVEALTTSIKAFAP